MDTMPPSTIREVSASRLGIVASMTFPLTC
jgi:hypothetical protein